VRRPRCSARRWRSRPPPASWVVSVKWIEDRNEHLTCGAQAREESIDVEAAVTENGIIRGLKVSLVLDQGAYPGFRSAGSSSPG